VKHSMYIVMERSIEGEEDKEKNVETEKWKF
jgi:hypothetical protein